MKKRIFQKQQSKLMLITDRVLNRNLEADRDQDPNLKADQGPVRSHQGRVLEVDLLHIRRPDQQANLPTDREGRKLDPEQIVLVVEVELDPDHLPGNHLAYCSFGYNYKKHCDFKKYIFIYL